MQSSYPEQMEREADGHMANAAKHLSTSFFKRTRSYARAAEEFEKAAQLYSGAKQIPKANEAWAKAVEAHEKAKDNLAIARTLEIWARTLITYVAMGASAESSTPTDSNAILRDAVRVYERAAKVFAAEFQFQRQAAMYIAASQALGDWMSQSAALRGAHPTRDTTTDNESVRALLESDYRRLVLEAIQVLDDLPDGNASMLYRVPELYRPLILHQIRRGEVAEAVRLERRAVGIRPPDLGKGHYSDEHNIYRRLNQPANAAKAGLEIIVLCLAGGRGDIVWARQEMSLMRNVFGFRGSAEEQAADTLLDAFCDGDKEQVAEAVKQHSCFRFLLPDVSRMANKLGTVTDSQARVSGSQRCAGKEKCFSTVGVDKAATASDPSVFGSAPKNPEEEEDLR